MARITITLQLFEKDALRSLAEREYRDPRAQAALIIRRELERMGLLRTQESNPRESKVENATLQNQRFQS